MAIQNVKVTLPNGDTVNIDRIGTVKFFNNLCLSNVLFVPLFAFNLLSISALTHSHNCCVNFPSNSCLIQDLTQGLTIGRVTGKTIFIFLELGPVECNSARLCSVISNTEVWHSRHPSSVKLQILHNELHLPSSLSLLSSYCKICYLAKQKRLLFVSHNNMSANAFDLVHLDIWGPFHVSTPANHKYFLIIVDDCTRATWVYLLLAKLDVLTVFLDFFAMVSTQFHTIIKSVYSDNVRELDFHDFFFSFQRHYFLPFLC